MTERIDDIPPSTPSALRYPFTAPPAPGSTLEIAPGVRWLRMPLPWALDHINVWLIDEAEGCAVVDTGARTDAATAVWRATFAPGGEAQTPPRVTRVLVTHMHPDHVGMAGWLTRAFDCRLWMTRAEYFNCRVAAADTGREAPPTRSTSIAAPAGASRPSTSIARVSAALASISTRCRKASGVWRMAKSCALARMTGA